MQEMQDPMESSTVPGTEGYEENAGQLIARYDNVTFLDKYRPVSHLLPTDRRRRCVACKLRPHSDRA